MLRGILRLAPLLTQGFKESCAQHFHHDHPPIHLQKIIGKLYRSIELRTFSVNQQIRNKSFKSGDKATTSGVSEMESSGPDSTSQIQEDQTCAAAKVTDIPERSTDHSVSMVTSSAAGGDNSNHGNGVSSTSKRSVNEVTENVQTTNKKVKLDTPTAEDCPVVSTSDGSEAEKNAKFERVRRKKVAMLMVYSGTGYNGMQRNPPYPTIEEELLSALHKIGAITDDHYNTPQKMHFQRAARTDKGVSALGQVVSLQLPVDMDSLVEKVNELLPDQIRVLGMKRCTKGFNSKNHCMSRTYSYVTPTFAFAPIEEKTTEGYRVTDQVMAAVNDILSMYKGTHNFHNFTSGKKPSDPSAVRYMMEFKCSPVYEKNGIEFTVIRVRGQSFMLHQIRKMIGLMIAVVRGMASKESIDKAWQPEKCDVPIAPALGLMLEQLHYDAYNKRFGQDGMHDPITWDEYLDEIEAFKHKFVYPNIVQKEKEEKSMMSWLSTLLNHTFDVRRDEKTGIHSAYDLVKITNEQESRESDPDQNTSESSSQNKVINSHSEELEKSNNQSENGKELSNETVNDQSECSIQHNEACREKQ